MGVCSRVAMSVVLHPSMARSFSCHVKAACQPLHSVRELVLQRSVRHARATVSSPHLLVASERILALQAAVHVRECEQRARFQTVSLMAVAIRWKIIAWRGCMSAGTPFTTAMKALKLHNSA